MRERETGRGGGDREEGRDDRFHFYSTFNPTVKFISKRQSSFFPPLR